MRTSCYRFALLLTAAALHCGGASPVAAQLAPAAPEGASAWTDAALLVARRHMVVAAHPAAAEAGREILRAGGSAADAAIAVQLVLGLVEPQSSGLGGGALVTYWDAARRVLKTYDGRETAPSSARPDRFLRDGRPMPFGEAVRSGLSVGVPGTVRLLETLHQSHGKLPWGRLFEPALRLADGGFPVSPRLALLLAGKGASHFATIARQYFFDAENKAWPDGHRLWNTAYGETLRTLAEDGAKGFYEGPIAEAIVAAVKEARAHPGDITMADLAAYRVIEREPVCAPYRGYSFCAVGPPSSGALAVGQMLMLLEGFDLGRRSADAFRPGAMHLIGEAGKLAFADRNWYVGDPDMIGAPPDLLNPAYISERRKLIDPHASLTRAHPGLPPGAQAAFGSDATIEAAGTSHISVVDGAGNALSMTTTIEAAFGSGLWAAGFLLNNELTDFSFRPSDRNGRLLANRVEGGKRPRSSMTPAIVFDEEGTPRIVAGSAGGSRIIPYVLKPVVAVIDWKLDAQSAVALPNFGSPGMNFEMEMPDPDGVAWLLRPFAWPRILRKAIGIKAFGQTIVFNVQTSGTHIIVRRPDGMLEGGADPRREGVALGD